MKCAPLYFSGPWDAVVVPADKYFITPDLKQGPQALNVVVYGPAHLFRAAWLSGARDFLREPWEVEELFLRLRGPRPPVVAWSWREARLQLEGVTLSREGGLPVRLSAAESDVLRVLVLRRGTPVSRSVLAWDSGCSSGRVIDTLVGRLRKKLQGITGFTENPLVSVRGLGYRLP